MLPVPITSPVTLIGSDAPVGTSPSRTLPESTPRSVDLPHPDAPRMPTNAPRCFPAALRCFEVRGMFRFTESKICIRPGYVTERFSITRCSGVSGVVDTFSQEASAEASGTGVSRTVRADRSAAMPSSDWW